MGNSEKARALPLGASFRGRPAWASVCHLSLRFAANEASAASVMPGKTYYFLQQFKARDALLSNVTARIAVFTAGYSSSTYGMANALFWKQEEEKAENLLSSVFAWLITRGLYSP